MLSLYNESTKHTQFKVDKGIMVWFWWGARVIHVGLNYNDYDNATDGGFEIFFRFD